MKISMKILGIPVTEKVEVPMVGTAQGITQEEIPLASRRRDHKQHKHLTPAQQMRALRASVGERKQWRSRK